MADFYSEMAAMAGDLLSPTSQGGLGQGTLVLTHSVPGTVDPAEPWKPVTPVTKTQSIKGAVKGISSRLVGAEMGGTVLLASDREAITEVPSIAYVAGDKLSVDGKQTHIIAVKRIPEAGVTSAVKFYIRG